MPRMKAAVFVEPGRIVLDDKPIPDVGPLDALMRVTTTTICGTDVHILKGEYPVAKGLTIGHEPVGVIEKLGSAVQRLSRGPAGHRRRHHAVRHSDACLCGCRSQDGAGTQARLQGDRRLAVRQHHRRLPGRVRAGAGRDGQSGAGPRRADRRAGADVPRHHVDRLLRRRERQRPHRRHGGGVRAGADRPVRHGGREADAARPRSSASTACRRGWRSRGGWAPTSRRRLSGRPIRSRRSCA